MSAGGDPLTPAGRPLRGKHGLRPRPALKQSEGDPRAPRSRREREKNPLTLTLSPDAGERGKRRAILWLAVVTALGAALRLYHLGTDLWLDEIATVLDYRHVPALAVFADQKSLNNHPLNTLLVKAAIALFGEKEWAIRLPAALFGMASIPALYALARLALARRESLLAALLLAVSYHHVFFSQNARGYTAMLFFSILATNFFLRGVARGRARDWILYAVSIALASAAVLGAVFVAAGHAIALLFGIASDRELRARWKTILFRAVAAWAAAGLLCLPVYAAALWRMLSSAAQAYRGAPGGGFSLFSGEYVREVARGLTAGLGTAAIVGAAAVLAFLAVGFVLFLRRNLFYAAALAAPLFATAAFLLLADLRLAPRFFLWAVPVAWIFVMGSAASYERLLGHSIPWVAAAAFLVFSAVSLPPYYRVPKQPNRMSLDWVLAIRGAGDPIAGASMAKYGLWFYGPPRGLKEGESYFIVESVGDLERIEAASRGKTAWLLTTFSRGLRLDRPELDRAIRQRYRERRRFPATVGDASVTVWTREIPR